MPFLTELRTAHIKGNRWRLTQDLIYSSRRYGAVITAESGFEMDYASVPRLPLVYLLVGNHGHREAAIHDWLYRYGHGAWTRRQADLIFLDALLESQPKWRAYAMYCGVRAGGWWAWRRHARAYIE